MNPASPTETASSLSRRSQAAGNQPISVLMAQALAQPELISLAAGFVDQATLPVGEVQSACQRLLSDPRRGQAALQYGTTAGNPALREQVVARLGEADHQDYRDRLGDCLITAGSNQLLHLVAEAILNEGDVVLCAAPTYLVFLGTLTGVHATSWSVATDELGIVPEALEETLKEFDARGELSRVKAIYCVSYYDNPQGINTSEQRRGALVEIAKRWSRKQKIYVIDDTAYRELRYEGDDLPSLLAFDEDRDWVVETGTFSKSFSPGIRVGWGILPRELFLSVEQLKGNIDFGSPNFSQALMAEVLSSGDHDRHVAMLRTEYDRKREAMLNALESSFQSQPGVDWVTPQGGLYVWLTLPADCPTGPSGALFNEAVRRGVLYVPGQYAFAGQGAPIQENTIRLSFGVQTPEKIAQGIQLLAEAFDAVRTTSG